MVIDGRERNNAKRKRAAKEERRYFERRAIEAQFEQSEKRPVGLKAFELDAPRTGLKKVRGKDEFREWKQVVRPKIDEKKPWRQP